MADHQQGRATSVGGTRKTVLRLDPNQEGMVEEGVEEGVEDAGDSAEMPTGTVGLLWVAGAVQSPTTWCRAALMRPPPLRRAIGSPFSIQSAHVRTDTNRGPAVCHTHARRARPPGSIARSPVP